MLNFKGADEETLKRGISAKLKIPESNIILSVAGMETRRKYSTEAKTYKWYEHTLYQAEIINFPPILRQNSFVFKSVTYKWMTIDEMKLDPRIMRINKDVVNLVENTGI